MLPPKDTPVKVSSHSEKVAEGGAATEEEGTDGLIGAPPLEELLLLNNVVTISAPLLAEGYATPHQQFYRVGLEGELILFEEEISPSSAGTQAEGGDPLWAQHRPTSLRITSSEDNEKRTNDSSSRSATGGLKIDATRRNYARSPDTEVSEEAKEMIPRPSPRPSSRSTALLKVKVEKRPCGTHPARGSASRETFHSAPLRSSSAEVFHSSSKTSSVEAEVFGLMQEMKEVTKQIKSEVRQLRASDTPTPDTPTPLREFRDFLTKEEQEQEVGRLPTISEDDSGGLLQQQIHQEEAGTYNLRKHDALSGNTHPVDGDMIRQVGHPWAGWEYVGRDESPPVSGAFCPCGRHVTLLNVSKGVERVIDKLEASIRSKNRVEIENMVVTLQTLRTQVLNVVGGDVTPINGDVILEGDLAVGDVTRKNDVLAYDSFPYSVDRKCTLASMSFFPQNIEQNMPFGSDVANQQTENGQQETVTDTEDLNTEGDVESKIFTPSSNVEGTPTDEEDVVASGDECVEDQVDISLPEVDLESLQNDNLQEVISLTEGYAKQEEDDEIKGRHLKNVKKAEVFAKSFEFFQKEFPEEGSTATEDMEDSAVEEDLPKGAEGEDFPEHLMQEEPSFANHQAVNSIEVLPFWGCKKKNRCKVKSHLEAVYQEGPETITDVESLPKDDKRPRRRRRKKLRKEVPTKGSINVLSVAADDEGLTDIELLIPGGSSNTESSNDELQVDLVAPLGESNFTDAEDFSASDGNEDDVVVRPVGKEHPSIVPAPFDEHVRISEKEEDDSVLDEGTDEEGFLMDEKEDNTPLVRSLPLSVLDKLKPVDPESDEDANRLTDIEDVDIEENEDCEIIDDILRKIPAEETSILLDMECVCSEAVGEASEEFPEKMSLLTLNEDDEGALTDMEDSDGGDNIAIITKNCNEALRRAEDTDSDNVEGSDEEHYKSPPKKMSRKLLFAPQLSEVRFVETDDGSPLSIIVTSADEGHFTVKDNVKGIVFLEDADVLTDIEELPDEDGKERVDHESLREFSDEGPLTDLEDICDFPDRPETPTPPDELILPGPSRQNIKIIEDEFGGSQVTIEKLTTEDFLALPSQSNGSVLTDTEDVSDGENIYPYEEMNDKCDVLMQNTSTTEVVSKSKHKKLNKKFYRDTDKDTDEEDFMETSVRSINIRPEIEDDKCSTPYLTFVGEGTRTSSSNQASFPNQENSMVTMSVKTMAPFLSDVEEGEIKDFLLQECRHTPPLTEVESLDDEGEEIGDAFATDGATSEDCGLGSLRTNGKVPPEEVHHPGFPRHHLCLTTNSDASVLGSSKVIHRESKVQFSLTSSEVISLAVTSSGITSSKFTSSIVSSSGKSPVLTETLPEGFSKTSPSPSSIPSCGGATDDSLHSLTQNSFSMFCPTDGLTSPTEDSSEDHAEIDHTSTDVSVDSVKLDQDIFLMESKTEDEAPDIDEDLLIGVSPAGGHHTNRPYSFEATEDTDITTPLEMRDSQAGSQTEERDSTNSFVDDKDMSYECGDGVEEGISEVILDEVERNEDIKTDTAEMKRRVELLQERVQSQDFDSDVALTEAAIIGSSVMNLQEAALRQEEGLSKDELLVCISGVSHTVSDVFEQLTGKDASMHRKALRTESTVVETGSSESPSSEGGAKPPSLSDLLDPEDLEKDTLDEDFGVLLMEAYSISVPITSILPSSSPSAFTPLSTPQITGLPRKDVAK